MSTYVFKVYKKFVYHIIRGDNMYIPTLDPVVVGEVIAELRKRKGISQEVLSGLADIGRTHLSAIERGERKPTLETLYRISGALNMKMSDVIIAIEDRLEG
jgi:DNA-binding XRE family transcriptional regulator